MKTSNRATREITVDALLVQDGKILLDRRRMEPFSGMWGLPGGHVEFDETVEEAVIREVKEETNLDIKVSRLFSVFSNPTRDEFQRITIVYEVVCDDISGMKAGSDAAEVEWFGLDNLPKLAFDHLEIINQFIQNETNQ